MQVKEEEVDHKGNVHTMWKTIIGRKELITQSKKVGKRET